MVKIKQALISVSDKKNLLNILKVLKKFKIKILSSGGTFREIQKLGFNCKEVSEFTNSQEVLDGRVKTLHPKIHSGILNIRKNIKHQSEMKKNKFENIDLVIVNFYPFEKIISSTKNLKKIVENIDIGGPAMVRAAAKNYESVCVITNTHQYNDLIFQLERNKGHTTFEYREKLSEEAFNETAYYDSIISNYFLNRSKNTFPKKKTIPINLIEELRYGENPHQKASIYSSKKQLDIVQLHGKQLSYNNYNDIFAALSISKTLPKNLGTVIVKHANPCGVSINKEKFKSFKEALSCDPISAFGGIVSCNFKIDKKTAIELNKIFLEVVIGNGVELDAIKVLKRKKNLRIIDACRLKIQNSFNIVSNFSSYLYQSSDNKIFKESDFKIVSKRKPNRKIMKDLIFAFNICRNLKSNAIVLASNGKTIGIGSGQPSRLDSCKIAIDKMNKFQNSNLNGEIVAASDAFFPFVDGIETLVQAGVSAVIQPFGSIRDKEIIKFANQTNTILIFSKTRHFKH